MSLHWLLPIGARRFHAFRDGTGRSLCRRWDAAFCIPRRHNVKRRCVDCERAA